MADKYPDDRFRKTLQEVVQTSIIPRFKDMDQRFESIDWRFDRIDQRFDRIDQRLDGAEQQFIGINQRFESLEAAVRGNGVLLEDLEGRFTSLCEIIDESLSLRRQVSDHEGRLSEVENSQKLIKATLKSHSAKLKD